MKCPRRSSAEQLPAVDWFAQLDERARRAASRRFDRVDVAAGELLQRRGRRVRWLWVAVGTPLALHQDGEVIGLVGTGGVFGEREVLLGVPSDVDVRAVEAGLVLCLAANAYHGLLGHASFAGAAARRMAA